MKRMKQIFTVLVLALMAAAAALPLAGEPPRLFLNGGVFADEDFSFQPMLWSLGANLDIYIARFLVFSPEANLIGRNLTFRDFVLQPAFLLNLRYRSFFIGGGFMKKLLLTDDYFAGEDFWGMRLNAGVSGKTLRFRVCLDATFGRGLQDVYIGFQAGIGF